ncbi:MAG: hypothetical protein IPH78_13215 [Bacteroidetes bacterium]|nr:hypothetical protein [Bacteroidota bacterium]
MATLQKLHELIHALDKNEKKFLSLMIDGTAGKAKQRYADAFKDINSVKQYDAAKLKARLANGISGMNLSEANSNFYGFVCKAIVAYYGFEKNTTGLNKRILLIDILCTKGLFDTAMKMIEELMPIVKLSGTYAMMHRLHEIKNNIYINGSQFNKKYNERYAFYESRLQLLAENQQAVQITMLNTRFFELAHKTGDPRTKAQYEQYIQLSKAPLLQIPIEEVNSRSLGTFVQLKLTLEVVAGKSENVFELCENLRLRLKKIATGHELLSQEYFVVDFMTGEALQLQRKDMALHCLRELWAIEKKVVQKGVRQKIYARILMIELTVCLWEKNFTAVDKLLSQWMTNEKKNLWMSANLAYVNLLLAARVLYLSGKPDKALDYLLMMQEFEKVLRPNIHISYRFLFLLCHYKLKNYQFLTYATESLYRYLLKLDKLYAPERALLRFVKQCDHFEKVKPAMKLLYETLSELQSDSLNRPFFIYGDYNEWLQIELAPKRFQQ